MGELVLAQSWFQKAVVIFLPFSSVIFSFLPSFFLSFFFIQKMEFEWSVNDVVQHVSFSGEDAARDLLAFATDNRIVIARAILPQVPQSPCPSSCHGLGTFGTGFSSGLLLGSLLL